MNYAKAIIAGSTQRVPGREPESRSLPDDTPITSFSVAVTGPARRGAPETRTWGRVSVFGRQAEARTQSPRKGARGLVEGWPHRAYTSRLCVS